MGKLMEKLGQNEMNIGEKQVVHLSQDSFYRELNQMESEKARKGMFNFDHPNAFDNELMETCLQSILAGRQTQIPVYDFKTNARVPGAYTVLLQYTSLVKPAFEEFCIPTKKYADVIIPRGAENTVAIDLIKQHIEDVICKSNGNRPETIYERSRSNSDSTSR